MGMRRTNAVGMWSIRELLEWYTGTEVKLSFHPVDKAQIIVTFGRRLELDQPDHEHLYRRRVGERAVDEAWERNQ